MILRIAKLRNFGIFQDFKSPTDLPEFRRFNLLYGWNRSGKTTISRIFESCEKHSIYHPDGFKQYPEGGEFKLEIADGTYITESDVGLSTLPVKVFNQDFISDNISFDPENPCGPIYISEKDIESAQLLEAAKSSQPILEANCKSAKENKEAKEEKKNQFLIGLGREIANALFDKTYNKTRAENRIKEIGEQNLLRQLLPDEDKKRYEEISKSEAGSLVGMLPDISINLDPVCLKIKGLLEKQVISETITRLANDKELNDWTKRGFDLHKIRSEKDQCLFCGNTLKPNFFEALSHHFNEDYENLQRELIEIIGDLEKLRPSLYLESYNLYPDLRSVYIEKMGLLNGEVKQINSWLDLAVEKLKDKLANPLVIMTLNEDYPKFYIFQQAIREVNNVLEQHNNRVNNHKEEVGQARFKLEVHLIASALQKQSYDALDEELSQAKTADDAARGALESNTSWIKTLEQKSSNIGKAISEINTHLEQFFGRKEIQLELDESQKGYMIRRGEKYATNLSEGEKTAIAFSYFIVKVKENDFNVKDGIFYLDDPISSFDSNFVYHCFSLITNHFGEAKQLFISTHNFQLFNLFKEWFMKKNANITKDNLTKGGSKPMPSEFFMVENYYNSDVREARLVELEGTLKKFKSEYHFLFSLLCRFKDGTPAYADLYTIGNVARRFFDIFADFKIPALMDQRQKLESIVGAITDEQLRISDVDRDKVYKLLNEFSHNSDPTSAIEHKDKLESHRAVSLLLNIVQNSDPTHYEFLSKET